MDYTDIGLTPQLNSVESLINQNENNVVSYIDEQIGEIVRPGGLNYYNTSVGIENSAVVNSTEGKGAFSSIQLAINSAGTHPSKKVLLTPGTYYVSQPINVTTDGLQIEGVSRDNTVIKVINNADFPADTGNYLILFEIDANNVSLSNLTIDGNKAGQSGVGREISVNFDTSPSAYNNLYINNVNFINQYGTDGEGIFASSDGLVVKDCLFGTLDGWAIVSNSSDRANISNSSIINCGGGITTGLDNVITDVNVLTTTLFPGFRNWNTGATFRNCIGSNCFDYGFYSNSSRGYFEGCIAYNNGSAGFKIEETLDNRISGCLIYLQKNYPIWVIGTAASSNSSNNSIIGNTIAINRTDQLGSHGIVLDHTSENIIANNTFYLMGSGVADNTSSGIFMQGTANHNVIVGNSIHGRSSGTFNLAYGVRENSSSDDYNIITGNSIYDAGTQIGTQGANSVVGNNVLA